MITKQLSAHKNKILVGSIVYTILIVYLSLKTPSNQIELPSQSDKLFHALAYFVFTVLWVHTYKFILKITYSKAYVYAFLWALCFGVLMEVLQGLCTFNREPDIKDVLANLLGTVFAVLFLKYLIYKDR